MLVMCSGVQAQCERLRLSSVRPWPLDLLQICHVRDSLVDFYEFTSFSEMCGMRYDDHGAYMNYLAFEHPVA
jgi:hypothetical protein